MFKGGGVARRDFNSLGGAKEGEECWSLDSICFKRQKSSKCIVNIYYFHFFLSNISNGKNKINHELDNFTGIHTRHIAPSTPLIF